MKDSLENKQFEEQWQKAFDSQELKPSDSVWSGIDAHLANQNADNYKKRAVFYRWLAAASILILFTWSGYRLMNSGLFSHENSQLTTSSNEQTIDGPGLTKTGEAVTGNEQVNKPGENKTIDSNEKKSGEVDNFSQNPISGLIPDNKKEQDLTEDRLSTQIPFPDPGNSKFQITSVLEKDNDILIMQSGMSTELRHPESRGFDIIAMEQPDGPEVQAVPVWNFEIIKEGENDALWAGLNFAPGIFNPNFSNSSVAAKNLSSQSFNVPVSPSVTESEVDPGLSYRIGVNAGFPLGRKWVLQGGLEYMVGNSETNTSLIVEDASGGRSALVFTNANEVAFMDNSVSLASPTDVTSSYEFISVPIKAGYSILNLNKFGLMISGGVASDFFIKNEISTGQEGIRSFTQSAGSDSPFKSVYFSGLSSITFSYKLATNYLILVEPSYKRAINKFSRNSEIFESRPNSFGVGVGIRYQFKK